MRLVRSLACLAAVTAIAPTAFAQQGPAPGGSPPPPPGAPAPAEERDGDMRFRWGISGFGGKYFVNETGGGIGGIDARFGAQVNRMIGFYGSPILLVGAGAGVKSGATGASTNVSAVALYGVGALVDFTFADLFFVAVGPEILRGAAAQAATAADTNGGASSSASAEAGTFFGIEGRAGFAFGSMKPNKRKAFTIGLDLHTIFTSKVTVAPLLALGFDAF